MYSETYSLSNYIYDNLYGFTVLHTGNHGHTIYNRSQIYGRGNIHISGEKIITDTPGVFWRGGGGESYSTENEEI